MKNLLFEACDKIKVDVKDSGNTNSTGEKMK
ncbi:hypothetical protein SAMN05216324_105232 [Chryseobacterium limigenitum]|uniref:Uncharacterized protein n=1 Tax=Chryseobacterium limigenitum TaxID=1612149 RepID=A0A1K2IN31_9FLAO|nr:hypothetical protein SAMN05216324_105232 [Chryseobacterium limigenitum]